MPSFEQVECIHEPDQGLDLLSALLIVDWDGRYLLSHLVKLLEKALTSQFLHRLLSLVDYELFLYLDHYLIES